MKSKPPRSICGFGLRYTASVAAVLYLLIVGLSSAVRGQGDADTAQDAVAIFNQAQDAQEKGDLTAAIALYEKALKIAPEFPEAEYQIGSAYLSLGKIVEAESAFRKAVVLRDDWTLALASLGSILVQQGKLTEAEIILNKAIALDDQNFQAYSALAEMKLRIKAPPNVLLELLAKISAQTSKMNPTAALWVSRAALEKAVGKPEAAGISLKKALAIDPKNRYALTDSAAIALNSGDIARAREITARLERIFPGADPAKYLNAQILASEGKLDDALKMLDALKNPTGESDELRVKIVSASSTNAGELEARLEKDQKNAVLLARLCSLDRVDAPDKALDYCRRASEVEPNNINHAVGYGAALVQAKRFEQAVALFRRILLVAPENSTVHGNLAAALFQLKRYADAKIEYRWLIDRNSGLPVAYYLIGITHDQLGEYLDAMANYQQFLKSADPNKNELEISKVNLRLPALQRLIKDKKGK